MKPCIELAMTAYTNMTSKNTFAQMQERLHLINFPIAFLSSLFAYEEHNSINNDYTLINNAFHFNCKHCGLFLSEYFDFSYAYYVFSVCLFPEEGIDMKDLFNPDHLKVPTVAELKKDAERLLKSVIRFAKVNRRCKFYMTATGPFKVSYRYGIIELECIFTSWSCD